MNRRTKTKLAFLLPAMTLAIGIGLAAATAIESHAATSHQSRPVRYAPAKATVAYSTWDDAYAFVVKVAKVIIRIGSGNGGDGGNGGDCIGNGCNGGNGGDGGDVGGGTGGNGYGGRP